MKRMIYRLLASALCCSMFFSNRLIYAADETVANQFVSQYDEEPQDATEETSDNLDKAEEQEQNTESSLPETNTADENEDSSDDAGTEKDNIDSVIEDSEEEQDSVPQIIEEPEEKTEIEDAKEDAMELRAVAATAPTSWWVTPSDTNGLPSQINIFEKRTGGNNWYPTYTYQLYLPGGVDLNQCYLSWDGGATVTISGDSKTYSSGECPIPPRDSTVEYTFKYGNRTVKYNFVTYQGSDSDEVQQVFIEIDSSGTNPTMEEMDSDKDHKVTCVATVYINGVKYESAKIKGRGNATWKESVDKKPYNITLPEKINFPGVESDVTKKWSFLAECLDRSLLGNRAGYYLANQMGVGQDTTSADVWMNGEYQGCYTVTPKTDSFVKKNGYMIEQDNYKENPVAEGGDPQFTLEGLNTHVKGWDSSYNFITVKKIGDNILGKNASGKVDESPENLEAKAVIIQKWLQVAWDAIRSEDGWNNGHYYTEYIDIESFAKMYLIQEFVKSYDICTGSIYFYRNDATDGSADKLMAGPLWDLDNAMGSVYANTFLGDVGDRRSGEGDFIQSISNYQNYGEEYRTCIYKTIGKHNDFIDEVYYQYNQYRSVFDNLDDKLQEMADGIKDSAIMNHKKVEELGHNQGKDNHYYSSNTTLGSGQYQQNYVATEDWYDYVTNMETYIATRAKWFENTYTVQYKKVTFNSNGGTSSMEPQVVYPSRETPLNGNAFFRAGYSFAGWNTQQDGTGTAYTNKQTVTLNEDLTLYAQWTPIETAQIVSHTLSAKGEVGVNFYLNIPTDTPSDAVVRMDYNGGFDGEPKPIVNSVKDILADNGYRASYFVPAKEMRDTITVHLMDSEGNSLQLLDSRGREVPSSGYEFSVEDFINLANEVGSEKLKVFTHAMQVYGDWAQIYFNYKAGGIEPSTTGFENITTETLYEYRPEYSETMLEGLEYNYSTLMLKAQLGYRHYFTVSEGKDISNYTFVLEKDGTQTTLTPISSDGKYFVEVPNISAKNLGDKYKVTVSDGTNSWNIDYSAMSYAYKALDSNSTSTNLKQLVKALYLYYDAAKTYFSK